MMNKPQRIFHKEKIDAYEAIRILCYSSGKAWAVPNEDVGRESMVTAGHCVKALV